MCMFKVSACPLRCLSAPHYLGSEHFTSFDVFSFTALLQSRPETLFPFYKWQTETEKS